MAIQEIETSLHGSSTTGFKRSINAGAMGLVLDTIQVTQYTKPEESTVRELTANAVDSQREKEIAIKILSGEAEAKDYFLERDGAKYKDSNWDASYYDLKHLNTSKTNVELEYIEGIGTGYCDKFIVRDHGIGIGGSRLEGYFSIGFSTKRNSKASLGAFGFGAKVALSTRCDYYTTTTVHNGKKFKFNSYAYKIDSLTGKFDLIKKTENEHITFSDGSKIYYEATDEKNYTEIVIPTKRHHRSKYKQAVKAQLLYFHNVTYVTIAEDGYKHQEHFKAEILYNSDKLIVSNNNQFSKPHIVIVKGETEETATGVCYGFVDFQEMEMQQLYGNVGVKCPIRSVIRDDDTGEETLLQEGVEVTASRESVVWSEHTRNFLIKRFQEAVVEATTLIEKELQVTDILDWLGKCSGVKSTMENGGNVVLHQLSKVIDTNAISPTFGVKGIKLGHPETFFRGFRVRYCVSEYDYKKVKTTTKRMDFKRWSDFNADRVYFKATPTSTKTDLYLNNLVGSFITIELMDDEQLRKEYVVNDVISNNLTPGLFTSSMLLRDCILAELKSSKLLKNYDEVVVPDTFSKQVDDEEETEKVAAITGAQRRKALGEVAIHVMVPNSTYMNAYTKGSLRPFTFSQFDESLADVQDFDGEIIYGFLDDTERLMLLGRILNDQCPDRWPPYDSRNSRLDSQNKKFNNDTIRVIRISKQIEKHFKQNDRFKHVSDFFQKVEDHD